MPPFLLLHLHAGHAVHFRCRHAEAAGMRVDVMSRMRGVTDFHTLWDRRTMLEMDDGTLYNLLFRATPGFTDGKWNKLVEIDHP